jgi:spore maturation protein SpmA
MLNYIWIGFFLIAFVVGLIKLIFFQDTTVFPKMMEATFEMAKTGFTLSIGLTGVMTLWLGLMKIGERGGMITIISRLFGPFFARLFPEVPKDHPANGAIIMNFSANILGLDNAATPLGLKAMKELQEINPNKELASNAQIMFLVLNASGLTIIPIAIIADRVTMGSANPTSIFIPILIAHSCATLAGLIYVSIRQKINLLDPVMLAYLLGMTGIIGMGVYYFAGLSQEDLQSQSLLMTSLIIISLIVGFISMGVYRKIPIFETFIEGAKEGFETAIKIIPYLVGILVAIGVFRESGTLNYLTDGIGWCLAALGFNTDFVPALPVAFLKPMSGQGARAMMIAISDAKTGFGPDSFVANMASIFRGAAETTFYIMALYFGSVNIRKTRYAVQGALIADLFGIIAGICAGYLFFH